MTHDETLRTRFPYTLAKEYETVLLENDARMRVMRLVELYEHALRHLSLIGLAEYLHLGLHDSTVESAREPLGRPSLGHWLALLRAVDTALTSSGKGLLTPPANFTFREGAIFTAAQKLSTLLGESAAKKVRHGSFLDTLVVFRNKKIGHGSLTPLEAQTIVVDLEAALTEWLAGQTALTEQRLIHIRQVVWEVDHFLYDGVNLTAGTSIYPAQLQGQTGLTHNRLYLSRTVPDTAPQLIPLYPLFAFDPNTTAVYVYNELSNKGQLILRCPYQSETLTLDEPADPITGTPPPPAPPEKPTPQPGQGTASPDTVQPQPDTPVPPQPEGNTYTPMKSWYDLITPHQDIRNGAFDEAIFAADLGDVAAGNAPQDYRDPYLFFKKTYPTAGLKNMLLRVQQTLVTGQGSSVIQIQTPFGGGKTHALVAIYHYLKHGQQVRELLPAGVDPVQAKVAALAGNHWNPVEGHTTNGLTRRTFWGEVAYQIGGRDGYEQFRENDEARISPGKDKLRRFLEAHQPFVLLFDEILEYINRALDEKYQTKEKTGVSLGTQTFSFFQELTEAVSVLPKGMIVVTLPSSFLENYGEQEEESLARLGKIFGRLESIETPVQGEEIYAVIRRRLFEVEGLKTAKMREVVHSYFQLYQQNHEDLPHKVRDASYRDKMELAYPFHPEVIDILYEKWSTFSTFQRTRGVLRMLANIIEDLYQREVPLDIILPGDLNMDRSAIRQEFLKHIGPEYEGVIASDIAGHEAKSALLDAANKPWKHLAQRIATSVFFHSFSADEGTRGINLPYIKLAVLRSDTIPALATDVLGKLNNTLWYLNSRGDAYYFSRIPNLNRMILAKKELYTTAYEEELKKVIEKEIGNKFRPYLWPEASDGIPDNRELKLLILRPEDTGSKVKEWIERKGNNFREFKNTLFFALADTAGFGKLREDVKTFLALQDIKKEIDSGHSPLPNEKKDEVNTRIRDLTRDYSYNVRRMYHVIRYGDTNGGRVLDLGQPVTGKENLDAWFWRELTSSDTGAILTQLHYRTVVNKFLTQNDQLTTSILLDQFYKNPELPALSEQGVLARAIQLGVQDGAFGLIASQAGELILNSLKFRVHIPLDAIPFDADTLLLTSARCEAILAQRCAEEEANKVIVPPPVIDNTTATPPPIDPSTTTPTPLKPQVTTYHRVRLTISDIPASKIADINRGLLLPLNRAVGDFKFTIELDVESADGISQATLENQIKETLRQIGARVVREDVE